MFLFCSLALRIEGECWFGGHVTTPAPQKPVSSAPSPSLLVNYTLLPTGYELLCFIPLVYIFKKKKKLLSELIFKTLRTVSYLVPIVESINSGFVACTPLSTISPYPTARPPSLHRNFHEPATLRVPMGQLTHSPSLCQFLDTNYTI